MNPKNLFVLLAAATGAAYLIKTYSSKKTGSPASAPVNEDNAKVVHLVEETLHQHEGEDNPIVHAFEAALKPA